MKRMNQAGTRVSLGLLIAALSVVGCGQPESNQEPAAAAASAPAEPSRPAAEETVAEAAPAAEVAEAEEAATDAAAAESGDSGEGDEVITELQIIDTKVGDGATAEAGQMVVVHYTGWLYDPGAEDNKGAKFDSSVDRGQPFQFPLGMGRVIRGWDEGVQGMKVGGRRKLTIPPQLGYGSTGAGGVIPANATLVFEVELLEVI